MDKFFHTASVFFLGWYALCVVNNSLYESNSNTTEPLLLFAICRIGFLEHNRKRGE